MKKLLSILFAIIALQMSITAQVEQKALYQERIKTYTKMKTTGISLSIAGGIIGSMGLLVASTATEQSNSMFPSDEEILGDILTISGTIMVGCGVTFWAIGGAYKTKYTRKLNALTLNLNPGMHQKISLVYRF